MNTIYGRASGLSPIGQQIPKSGLNDINDIPKGWRAALATVQTIVPSAVIAGGALRDREHGKPVKDLDIFIPANSGKVDDLEDIKKALYERGWQVEDINGDKMYPEGCDTRVVGVLDCKPMNCPPVQIIVGEWDTHDLFRHFDFGICQISFDGRRIKRSREYVEDHHWRRFRIVTPRSDTAFVCSINRWARLKQKYEGWTFNLGTRGSGAGNFTLAGSSG